MIARNIRIKSCMAITGVATRRIILEWRNAHQHHASLNHAQVFRGTARNIDDSPPMLAVHTIIDLDDSAAVIIDPPDRHLRS